MGETIFTVFAGRKANIQILTKYLQRLLTLGLVDQVHFWNYTRNVDDQHFLESISNLRRTSSKGQGRYITLSPYIDNNTITLRVRAANDIHIKLCNGKIEYEIVLGAYKNTKLLIRCNGDQVYTINHTGICEALNEIEIRIGIAHSILSISKGSELLADVRIAEDFAIGEIMLKTGHGSVGMINYESSANRKFYFMDTCKKSPWSDYYTHYRDPQYTNDIIIKCDDDILFIDIPKFKDYIDYVKEHDVDLCFANIVNNGVAAYYQQKRFNLIPETLVNLEYPPEGRYGRLWGDGKKAELLHEYFLNNQERFLEASYDQAAIDITTRFSINFFAYRGNKWDKIRESGNIKDDEGLLTGVYVKNRGFKNVMYTKFYVAHLSFYKQEETGINSSRLREMYDKIAPDR